MDEGGRCRVPPRLEDLVVGSVGFDSLNSSGCSRLASTSQVAFTSGTDDARNWSGPHAPSHCPGEVRSRARLRQASKRCSDSGTCGAPPVNWSASHGRSLFDTASPSSVVERLPATPSGVPASDPQPRSPSTSALPSPPSSRPLTPTAGRGGRCASSSHAPPMQANCVQLPTSATASSTAFPVVRPRYSQSPNESVGEAQHPQRGIGLVSDPRSLVHGAIAVESQYSSTVMNSVSEEYRGPYAVGAAGANRQPVGAQLSNEQQQRLIEVYVAENGIGRERVVPLLLSLGVPPYALPSATQIDLLFTSPSGEPMPVMLPQRWLQLVAGLHLQVVTTAGPPPRHTSEPSVEDKRVDGRGSDTRRDLRLPAAERAPVHTRGSAPEAHSSPDHTTIRMNKFGRFNRTAVFRDLPSHSLGKEQPRSSELRPVNHVEGGVTSPGIGAAPLACSHQDQQGPTRPSPPDPAESGELSAPTLLLSEELYELTDAEVDRWVTKVFTACGAVDRGWGLVLYPRDIAREIRRRQLAVPTTYVVDAMCELAQVAGFDFHVTPEKDVQLAQFRQRLLAQLGQLPFSGLGKIKSEVHVRGLSVVAAVLSPEAVRALRGKEVSDYLCQKGGLAPLTNSSARAGTKHAAPSVAATRTPLRAPPPAPLGANTIRSTPSLIRSDGPGNSPMTRLTPPIKPKQRAPRGPSQSESASSGAAQAAADWPASSMTAPAPRTQARHGGTRCRYMEPRPMDEITASIVARAKARKVLDQLRHVAIPVNRREGFAHVEYVRDESLLMDSLEYLDDTDEDSESTDRDDILLWRMQRQSLQRRRQRSTPGLGPLLPGMFQFGGALHGAYARQETFDRLSAPRFTTWHESSWTRSTSPSMLASVSLGSPPPRGDGEVEGVAPSERSSNSSAKSIRDRERDSSSSSGSSDDSSGTRHRTVGNMHGNQRPGADCTNSKVHHLSRATIREPQQTTPRSARSVIRVALRGGRETASSTGVPSRAHSDGLPVSDATLRRLETMVSSAMQPNYGALLLPLNRTNQAFLPRDRPLEHQLPRTVPGGDDASRRAAELARLPVSPYLPLRRRSVRSGTRTARAPLPSRSGRGRTTAANTLPPPTSAARAPPYR